MTTTALIPARGGSKGIPRKNVRMLAGLPLVAHSIRHAQDAESIDAVHVSTEDTEIAKLALQYDAEVILRPHHLAEDDVPTRAVEDHAIHELGLAGDDILVTLHPTSPLRAPWDIDACVRALSNADECRSVCPPDRHPYLMFQKVVDDHLVPFMGSVNNLPRQQFPTVLADVGAVWARRIEPKHGGRLVGHEVPPERSVDIDTELDFHIAEMLMKRRRAGV